MKKNDLNVFTYGYIKTFNPRFIWDNIKQFFRNFKYAWQRATKGYCNQDVWNLDNYITLLLRDTIEHLANTTHGYPGKDAMDTPEKWDDCLRTISQLLDNSIDRSFEDNQIYKNVYEDEYLKLIDKHPFETEELPDGCFRLVDNKTPEEQDLVDHYLDEETKIYYRRVADRNRALDLIKIYFDDLWD